ncbi:MAG: AbrB/MazE/SpoVT family DNA-binding domain-containing protein [Promethearchaeota archaeon]
MIIGKLSKKGQISIPKSLRLQCDLNPGDAISFKIISNKIVLEKINFLADNRMISEILLESEPLEINSIKYQQKLRNEWK